MSFQKNFKYIVLVLTSVFLFVLLGKTLDRQKSEIIKEGTEVVMTAKVLKNDVFQLFYWEQGDDYFQIEKSIKTEVMGSNDFQELKFVLPQISDLYKLRLDIGENFEQDQITIKELKIVKKSDTYSMNVDEFKNLFIPNPYVSTLNEAGSYKGISVIQNETPIYDPYFESEVASNEFNLIKYSNIVKYPFLISGFVALVLFLFVIFNIDKIFITAKEVFIAMFFLVLILPTIQDLFNISTPLENTEKRELAKKPILSFNKEFFHDYETFYNDNFGFRNNLVNFGGDIKTQVFRSSTHPDLVMFGQNKWLYYNSLKGRIYGSYSRRNLLHEEKLNQVIAKWEDNKSKFEANGRKYFLAFWPNKPTIYPEYLPYAMRLQIKDTISRVDQIIDRMDKNNSSIKLLDVRSKLLSSKADYLLYHKFDSHWNSFGAFLAYQEFFNKNYNELGIKPKTLSDFDVTWGEYNQGELIQMLGVQNRGFFLEQNPTFVLKNTTSSFEFLSTQGYPPQTVITRNLNSENNLKVLIFRDSFMDNLIQFFSLHFSEVTYIWGHDENYVNQLNPDIIIDCFVEREIGEKIQ